MNAFSLHHQADVFSIRPRGRGCLEICRQREGGAIGEVEYRGVIASELVSSLPAEWEPSMQAFIMWMLVFYIQHERQDYLFIRRRVSCETGWPTTNSDVIQRCALLRASKVKPQTPVSILRGSSKGLAPEDDDWHRVNGQDCKANLLHHPRRR